jgi:hypothetical protein
LVTGGVTEDRAETRLKGALTDLAEGEAFSDIRKGFQVQLMVGWRVLQNLLKPVMITRRALVVTED